MTIAFGLAPALVLVAYVGLAVASVVLVVIDLRSRRLPDMIVLPTFALLLVLFTAAALLTRDGGPVLRAVIGAAGLCACYLVVALLSRGGMGFGDVKLAALLGLATAWAGWPAFVVGAASGFLLGGVYGLVLLALRRARRDSAVPFGPWMLAGAWIGILAGGPVWSWYAALAGLQVAA